MQNYFKLQHADSHSSPKTVFHTPGRHLSAAFTLIELLVVIAIIAILASMLMPALQQARESGKGANCKSNLKQLATALEIYTTSFNDYYPTNEGERYTSDSNYRKNYAGTLMDLKMISVKCFFCPSERGKTRADYRKSILDSSVSAGCIYGLAEIDYGYNHYSIGGTASVKNGGAVGSMPTSTPAKKNLIKKPASTILLADSMGYGSDGMLTGKGTFRIYPRQITTWPGVAYPAHRNSCNVAWVDGHVDSEYATASDLAGVSYLYSSGGSRFRNGSSFFDDNCWDRE